MISDDAISAMREFVAKHQGLQQVRDRLPIWWSMRWGGIAQYQALFDEGIDAMLAFRRKKNLEAGHTESWGIDNGVVAYVDHLMLDDPEIYYRWLQSYFVLIGETKVWWRANRFGEDPAWPSAVRAAIAYGAERMGISSRELAQRLDSEHYSPKMRARIIEIARENYERGIR